MRANNEIRYLVYLGEQCSMVSGNHVTTWQVAQQTLIVEPGSSILVSFGYLACNAKY